MNLKSEFLKTLMICLLITLMNMLLFEKIYAQEQQLKEEKSRDAFSTGLLNEMSKTILSLFKADLRKFESWLAETKTADFFYSPQKKSSLNPYLQNQVLELQKKSQFFTELIESLDTEKEKEQKIAKMKEFKKWLATKKIPLPSSSSPSSLPATLGEDFSLSLEQYQSELLANIEKEIKNIITLSQKAGVQPALLKEWQKTIVDFQEYQNKTKVKGQKIVDYKKYEEAYLPFVQKEFHSFWLFSTEILEKEMDQIEQTLQQRKPFDDYNSYSEYEQEEQRYQKIVKHLNNKKDQLAYSFLLKNEKKFQEYYPLIPVIKEQIAKDLKSYQAKEKEKNEKRQASMDSYFAQVKADLQQRKDLYRHQVFEQMVEKNLQEFKIQKMQHLHSIVDQNVDEVTSAIRLTRHEWEQKKKEVDHIVSILKTKGKENIKEQIEERFILPKEDMASYRIEESFFHEIREELEKRKKHEILLFQQALDEAFEQMKTRIFTHANEEIGKFDRIRDQVKSLFQEVSNDPLMQKKIQERSSELMVEIQQNLRQFYHKQWGLWPKTQKEWLEQKEKFQEVDFQGQVERIRNDYFEHLRVELVSEILKKLNEDMTPLLTHYDEQDQNELAEEIRRFFSSYVNNLNDYYLMDESELLQMKKQNLAFEQNSSELLPLNSECLQKYQTAEVIPLGILGFYQHLLSLKAKTEKQKESSSPSISECLTCAEEEGDKIQPFTCQHSFCATGDCFPMTYDMQFKEKKIITCPIPGCQGKVDYPSLRQLSLLPQKALFKGFCQDYQLGLKADKHWLDCRTSDCQGGVIDHDHTRTRFDCGVCGYNYCKKCPENHDKFTTCAEYRKMMIDQQDPIEKMKALRLIKKCPNPAGCTQWITKGGGCLHMKCPECHFDFNWETMKPWEGVAWFALQNGENINADVDDFNQRQEEQEQGQGGQGQQRHDEIR